MNFPLIERFFGDRLQAVHTISGAVSLVALAVVAVTLARMAWFARQRAPVILAQTPVVEVIASSNSELTPRFGPDDDDVEPTIVTPIASLLPLEAGTWSTPPESELAPADEERTSQVLLVCHDDIEPDEATSPQARILITASGVSDRGKKRRSNEDRFLLLHDHAVFAVADGMGGYNGGEIASTLAVDTVREAFENAAFSGDLKSNRPLPRRGRELACSLLAANRAVLSVAQSKPELSQMGTTLVAARFSANKQRVYIANVGDSRCYRLRNGKLSQLTTDHNMLGLGDHGPTKNQLYRAIGVKQVVDVDIVVDIPQADDLYLLCSDGLTKMAGTDEIEEILNAEPDVEVATHRLIELANLSGGRDNVTVVLVRVQERIGRVEGPPQRIAGALDSQRSQRTRMAGS